MIEPIRTPNITGPTDREQLKQIKSFLHQMVGQLNYTLSVIDAELKKAQDENIHNNDSDKED